MLWLATLVAGALLGPAPRSGVVAGWVAPEPFLAAAAPSRTGLLRAYDGKQKRKPSPAPAPPPPPAPKGGGGRVTTDRLISVRKQIALANAFKAKNTRPSSPKTKTSFRRRKTSESDAERAAAAAAADLGMESNYTNMGGLPLLLVDGYNVIGQWARLKKRRDKNDMDGARQLLLDELVEYNSPKQYDMVCVFDAIQNTEAVVEAHFGVAVVYAPNADHYIEAELRRLGEDGGGRTVITATGDRAIQTAAMTNGAQVLSAKWLGNELKSSRAASGLLVDEVNKVEFRRAGGVDTLWDSLDVNTQQMLSDNFFKDPMAGLTRREREAMERAKEATDVKAKFRALNSPHLGGRRKPTPKRKPPPPPPGGPPIPERVDGGEEARRAGALSREPSRSRETSSAGRSDDGANAAM